MNKSPKQFQKWSSEQGDQKWQHDGQEHGFEQRDDFFWRKTKSMGARISEGDPRGAHKPRRCALGARGPLMLPPGVVQCQKFLNNP